MSDLKQELKEIAMKKGKSYGTKYWVHMYLFAFLIRKEPEMSNHDRLVLIQEIVSKGNETYINAISRNISDKKYSGFETLDNFERIVNLENGEELLKHIKSLNKRSEPDRLVQDLKKLYKKAPKQDKEKKVVNSTKVLDPNKKIEIEKRAVKKVRKYYKQKGYKVRSVEKENVGWDLDVTKNKENLKVEVKGTSLSNINVELTPNEYEKMNEYCQDYRVAIVSNVLSSPELSIYKFKRKKYELECIYGDKIVKLKERIAAIISENRFL